MVSLKTFTVHVECDGEKLEEYDLQVRDDVVTCWIESRVGKTFKVVVSNTDTNRACECIMLMDGKELRRPILKKDDWRSVDGVPVDSKTMQPFMFCPLELSDDDSLLHTAMVADKLGSIELRFTYVSIESKAYELWDETRCKDINSGPVHERTKKLASHRIGVSAEKVQMEKPFTWISTKPLDPTNPGPAATICFKYRPREFLEAQGFVEPVRRVESSPTPEPIPRCRNPSQSHGQSSRKKRRRTAGDEDKENIKVKEENEELDDEDDDGDDEEIRRLEAELERRRQKQKRRRTGVKKEPKPEPDTIAPLIIGEDGVIDLTQD